MVLTYELYERKPRHVSAAAQVGGVFSIEQRGWGVTGAGLGREARRDLLFPAGPARDVARQLFGLVAGLGIVSPHTHVAASLLADDEPFADPASLLVTPDHYIGRLLHASGALPIGTGAATEPRELWRILCRNWPLFSGTASRLWLELELADLFDIVGPLDEANADDTYDTIATCLAGPAYRPQALFERFGVEVLATTDAALAPLDAHRALGSVAAMKDRVIPTLRPDNVLDPSAPGWAERVVALGAAHDVDSGTWDGYLDALRRERARFAAQGAVSTDHGPRSVSFLDLAERDATRLFEQVLHGTATRADVAALGAHLLFTTAELACEDGLVMQLHGGVLRDHDARTAARLGPDIGADFPVAIDLTAALRPVLERFGAHPGFTLVVYSVDEQAYLRELVPMASYYPALRIGAPWWFLDTPACIGRALEHMADVAGFSRLAGFVDDARSFCSIPARHEVWRRALCATLAGRVVGGRMDLEEAAAVALDVVRGAPSATFGV